MSCRGNRKSIVFGDYNLPNDRWTNNDSGVLVDWPKDIQVVRLHHFSPNSAYDVSTAHCLATEEVSCRINEKNIVFGNYNLPKGRWTNSDLGVIADWLKDTQHVRWQITSPS